MAVNKKLPPRIGRRIKPYYTTEIGENDRALTITLIPQLDSDVAYVVVTFGINTHSTEVYYLECLADMDKLPQHISDAVREIAYRIREEQ